MRTVLLILLASIAIASCQKDRTTAQNEQEVFVTIDGEEYSLEFLSQIVSLSSGFALDSLKFNNETKTFLIKGYDLELDPKKYLKSK